MAELTGTKRQLDPGFSVPAPKNEPSKGTQKVSEFPERHPMSGRRNSSPEEMRMRIERRAYEIYEERGRESGRELDDWLRAEQEVAVDTAGSAE